MPEDERKIPWSLIVVLFLIVFAIGVFMFRGGMKLLELGK